ncbi:hypothetical protein Hanom_Chr00s142023g01819361 [Helianthus anomalus]
MCVKSGFVEEKKQTLFSLQTADIWSTSFSADACRCGPQTADLFPQKKQTAPKRYISPFKIFFFSLPLPPISQNVNDSFIRRYCFFFKLYHKNGYIIAILLK